MKRIFFDTETRETITETELKAEFDELKAHDPETYDYSFTDYIRNCTDKNGVLIQVTESTIKADIEDIITEMIDNGEVTFSEGNTIIPFIDDCLDEILSKFETYDDYRMTDLQSVVLGMIDVYRDLGIIEG